MENSQPFSVVFGYHPFSFIPAGAFEAGLTERFSVIIDTYCPSKGIAFFDADLYAAILSEICEAIPHDSLTCVMSDKQVFASVDELRKNYKSLPEDDRDPPERTLIKLSGQLAGVALTEEWALRGGPPPYHDSYTLSIFTKGDCNRVFFGICKRIAHERGLPDIRVHQPGLRRPPQIV